MFTVHIVAIVRTIETVDVAKERINVIITTGIMTEPKGSLYHYPFTLYIDALNITIFICFPFHFLPLG